MLAPRKLAALRGPGRKHSGTSLRVTTAAGVPNRSPGPRTTAKLQPTVVEEFAPEASAPRM